MTTTTPPRPYWLDHYMTTSGLPDPRHTGTTARPHRCHTCHRIVLSGYDGPLLAALATVDPYQATPQLEAAAVILAIPTYQLWGWPGTYELTERHYPGLNRPETLRPANNVVVVIAHRCAFPPLATAPLPTRLTAAPQPTNPPF